MHTHRATLITLSLLALTACGSDGSGGKAIGERGASWLSPVVAGPRPVSCPERGAGAEASRWTELSSS